MAGTQTTVSERLKNDPLAVDASPTKAFFVNIITRDIQLDKAIEDLVDNCVDGAKRLRPGAGARYDGLWIKINVSPAGFTISDNCGGINLHTARHYAFKFGRAEGFEETPFSVGQFGVGMKRALFKMGKTFFVKTVEPNASFRIDVNVPEWLRNNDTWDFRIKELDEGPQPQDSLGTTVHVEELYPGVAQTFGSDVFITNLRNQIRVVQQHFMRSGLQIVFNDQVIISNAWQLKSGEGIEPFFRVFEDDLGGKAPLKTRLYAGVGESSRAHAGWYVFCNGRCILEAEQSPKTGWGDLGEEGTTLPKYHNQFSRFRGYAFLDCEDASLLPWNTTKTDLEFESSAYRRLRGRLVDAARPVIDFLNKLDAETDVEEDDRQLTRALAKAVSTPLERLSEKPTFTFVAPTQRRPALASISFKKPLAEADRLKDVLQARNYKHLGELSFDYAFNNLVDEDDA
jgi:hypothetical protein